MPNPQPTKTNQFLIYTTPAGEVTIQVYFDPDKETIWATQKQIAELFGVGVPAISKHLSNIFESGEIQENKVISILETTALDGKNYLTEKEVKSLERSVSGFFDYIEGLIERENTFIFKLQTI